MRMLNAELHNFCKFLLDLEVSAKESRMRGRFLKIANERLKELEEERLKMLQKYAKKDENGRPIVKEVDGQLVFDVEDMEAFQREFNEMMLEEFVLDETEERKDMLLAIKNMVLNTDKKFKGQEALQYDRWCEIVEQIKYPDE